MTQFLLAMAAADTAGGRVASTGIIIMAIWIPIIAAVYFIPTIIAHRKGHINKTAVTLLNIFLGWTFIGWVAALVWAVMKKDNG